MKRLFSLLLAFVFCFAAVGCADRNDETSDPNKTDAPALGAVQMRESRYTYLTLWSWQIPDTETAAEYADLALECGFSAVDLAVLWADVEPIKGHFDWTYLDGLMNVFYAKGLNVSLQLLLWTKDLDWANELDLQKTANGATYSYPNRGGAVAFSSSKNRETVKNTLQNFALHAATVYSSILTRWGIRLSSVADADYATDASLDFSESSLSAFYTFLANSVGSYKTIGEKIPGVTDRASLESAGATVVCEAFETEWRLFRQEQLTDFLSLCFGVLRSADETVPIVWNIGTFGNAVKNRNSAILDLKECAHGLNFDILQIALNDGIGDEFFFAVASDLTEKELSVELDGAFAIERGDDIAAQALLCGRYGVFALSTANFTRDQLRTHKETLKTCTSAFFTDETPSDRNTSAIVFLNAQQTDFADKTALSVYGEVWATASDNGTHRIGAVTLGSDESLDPTGITDLYFGKINASISLSEVEANTLISANIKLHIPKGYEIKLTVPDEAEGLSDKISALIVKE